MWAATFRRPDVIDQRVVREVRDGTWHYIGTNGPNYTINGMLQTNSVGPGLSRLY